MVGGTREGTWITRAETEEFAGSEPDAFWRRLVGRFAEVVITEVLSHSLRGRLVGSDDLDRSAA